MAKLFGEAFEVGLDCGGPELGGGFSAGDRCLSLILFTKEEGLPLETRTGDRCFLSPEINEGFVTSRFERDLFWLAKRQKTQRVGPFLGRQFEECIEVVHGLSCNV